MTCLHRNICFGPFVAKNSSIGNLIGAIDAPWSEFNFRNGDFLLVRSAGGGRAPKKQAGWQPAGSSSTGCGSSAVGHVPHGYHACRKHNFRYLPSTGDKPSDSSALWLVVTCFPRCWCGALSTNGACMRSPPAHGGLPCPHATFITCGAYYG